MRCAVACAWMGGMARSDKKDGKPAGKTPEPKATEQDLETFSAADLETLSALQLCDLIQLRLRYAGADGLDVGLLRNRVAQMEEIQDEARTAIEKLSTAVEKLRAPALRLGTLIHRIGEDRGLVCVGGTDYVCNVDPELPEAALEIGARVLLNEAFAVTDSFGLDKSGPVTKVAEVLADGRLRVGSEGGLSDTIVGRATAVAKEKIKVGTEVRLDANQKVAVEIIGMGKRLDRTLTHVEELPWSAIGGQEEAVRAIRDSIELPLLHADLFKRFKHSVPKGFLLHGPPGCGKTLLGRATAHNLRLQLRDATGVDRPEFFLSVKGPEILNMWLGESERQVRDLFTQCREKAAEGHLAFLFIDEAESILGTRHAPRGGSNILSTLVPMFCTEMDGLQPLQNVVVILASNRADLIDPAILRPGRIDRKIRVRRPDEAAAREIYGIYLAEDLPLAEPRADLITAVSTAHYAKTEENRFLEVSYRSGRQEYLFRGDLASGAIIAAIVERAKEYAIVRSIAEKRESPITRRDLLDALAKEYQENEVFPPNDLTEDWLKLTDFSPENVVRLTPYRSAPKAGTARSAAV
ncbi:MAG: spoVK [Verrucomicrobia bacterium]|nr:spoVK [Verrucomicrobiota bacterium]